MKILKATFILWLMIHAFFMSQYVNASEGNGGEKLFDDITSRMFKSIERVAIADNTADEIGLQITTKSQGPKYKAKGLGFERLATYNETFLVSNGKALELKNRNIGVNLEKMPSASQQQESNNPLAELSSTNFKMTITRDLRSFGGELQVDDFELLLLDADQELKWSDSDLFNQQNIRKSTAWSGVWVRHITEESN